MVTTTFGQDLKEWRTGLGLTQTQAARRLLIGQSWYSKLEKDTENPGPNVVDRFAALRHAASRSGTVDAPSFTALLEELHAEAGRNPQRAEEALRIAVSLIRFVSVE